jgi:hypothetical protein
MREDRQMRDAVLDAHQELFWVMTRLPFPTVAAVNGPAVGAGVTVALLCDLVVMAEDTFLSDPRVSLGLLDGAGGLVLWPLLTSMSAAKEHLLLGDRVSGTEAHRLGLANRAVPASDVLEEALQLARRLAALPARAVREARQLLNSHIDRAAVPGLCLRRKRVVSNRGASRAAGAPCCAGGSQGRGDNVVGADTRVALVTGGTRGIGRAITDRLTRSGVTVAAVYARDVTAAQALRDDAARNGATVTLHQADVGQSGSCQTLVAEVLEQHGRLDYLVNNAGMVIEQRLSEVSAEDWERHVAENRTSACMLRGRLGVHDATAFRARGQHRVGHSPDGEPRAGRIQRRQRRHRRTDQIQRPRRRAQGHHRELRDPRQFRHRSVG